MNRKKTILLVDDDEMLLDITKKLLADDERFEIITHQHGFGVLNLVSQLQPDLVLLDINMPAFSGDKLAVLMRTNVHTSHIPIVFYSSNDEDSLREIVETCNVAGYICKGNILELRNKVNHYLNMPSSGAPGRTQCCS